jgi:hypothetical protein
MRRTEIRLSERFEEILARLLTLPSTATEIAEIRFTGSADSDLCKSARCDAEVKEALRCLYEAAHGRQVENAPYYVTTQYEFFLEAFTRILAGASPGKERANVSWMPGEELAIGRRAKNAPCRHHRLHSVILSTRSNMSLSHNTPCR